MDHKIKMKTSDLYEIIESDFLIDNAKLREVRKKLRQIKRRDDKEYDRLTGGLGFEVRKRIQSRQKYNSVNHELDNLWTSVGKERGNLPMEELAMIKPISELKKCLRYLGTKRSINSENIDFYVKNRKTRYVLCDQRDKRILHSINPGGIIYLEELSEKNKERILTPKRTGADFHTRVITRYLPPDLYLTSDGVILTGEAANKVATYFDLAQNNRSLMNRISQMTDDNGRVRNFCREARGEERVVSVRTETQQYLEQFATSVIEGATFANGGSYKAFEIGEYTFLEFNQTDNATYVFRTESWDPNTTFSRDEIRKTSKLGFVRRYNHDKGFTSWRRTIDRIVGCI